MASEEQPKVAPRTEKEIEAEYRALCATAGQHQYQITMLENDKTRIFARINDLNSEMAALKKASASNVGSKAAE